MKRDEPGKTRFFVLKGLVVWSISCLIFIILKLLSYYTGNLWVRIVVIFVALVFFQYDTEYLLNQKSVDLVIQITYIALIYLLFGIPIILFFAIILKFAEKAIDNIHNNEPF